MSNKRSHTAINFDEVMERLIDNVYNGNLEKSYNEKAFDIDISLLKEFRSKFQEAQFQALVIELLEVDELQKLQDAETERPNFYDKLETYYATEPQNLRDFIEVLLEKSVQIGADALQNDTDSNYPPDASDQTHRLTEFHNIFSEVRKLFDENYSDEYQSAYDESHGDIIDLVFETVVESFGLGIAEEFVRSRLDDMSPLFESDFLTEKEKEELEGADIDELKVRFTNQYLKETVSLAGDEIFRNMKRNAGIRIYPKNRKKIVLKSTNHLEGDGISLYEVYKQIHNYLLEESNDEMLFRATGLRKIQFESLVNDFEENNYGKAITNATAHDLLIYLAYMRSGSSYSFLSFSLNCSPSTISRVVTKSIKFIAGKLYPKYINFNVPPPAETTKTKSRLKRYSWLLKIFGETFLGSVDGVVIHWRPPANERGRYKSFKGGMGFNSQIICNRHLQIIHGFVGAEARENDAAMFAQMLKLNPNTFPNKNDYLLCDGGYGCSIHLANPFRKESGHIPEAKRRRKIGTTPKSIYNLYHDLYRNTIERCFSSLKNRFAVFSKPLMLGREKSVMLIYSALALHNFISLHRVTGDLMDELVDDMGTSSNEPDGLVAADLVIGDDPLNDLQIVGDVAKEKVEAFKMLDQRLNSMIDNNEEIPAEFSSKYGNARRWAHTVLFWSIYHQANQNNLDSNIELYKPEYYR